MFRPMRRFKQQISDAECKEILKNEKRGVLSLLGDDGYPYGLPISHLYSEEDNKIYFHGAKEGHKIDAIKNYDKASFCVYDSQLHRRLPLHAVRSPYRSHPWRDYPRLFGLLVLLLHRRPLAQPYPHLGANQGHLHLIIAWKINCVDMSTQLQEKG